MTTHEQSLWQRIQDFQLDDPTVAFKFSDRLARENGWSIVYAKRVIEEYKRFLFLCCVSEDGVTPSDQVDQAWHLHLTFTRSYWITLCKETLQRDIHHNPTKGGKSEADKFNAFYTLSQQLYIEKFGTQPPADIWHDNDTRFNDIHFKRVNVGKYWLLPKPQFSFKTTVLLMLTIAPAFLIQMSADMLMPLFIVGMVVVGAISSIVNKNNNNNDSKGGCTSSCNGGTSGCGTGENAHHHGDGHHHSSDSGSGCSSGCSGCSGSGCSGCGGGGD